MRILFLNPIANLGGAERVLLMAIAGVKCELPDSSIRLVTLADGPLVGAARQLGAEVEVVPSPGLDQLGDSQLQRGRAALALRILTRLPALASLVRRFRATVSHFQPDIAHSNGIKTHLIGRLSLPRHVPVVWHLHDFYRTRPMSGWLLRRARSRVRTAIAVSKAIATDARVVLPGVPVTVIPNVVDPVAFAPGPGDGDDLDRRSRLPVTPSGTMRIGLVGTYARWKGHLTLLDAAATLVRDQPAPPVRWYIIGGPIYHTAAQFTEAELRAAAEARGLAGHVGFVPFAADPVPVYRALDVVVHASTQPEPFGLTVAEAMSCGRAVIVSAAGGVTELFTDGEDALGVEPGNALQLADAVRTLVADPELRARLGAAARRTAVSRFEANNYGAALGRVYRSILS